MGGLGQKRRLTHAEVGYPSFPRAALQQALPMTTQIWGKGKDKGFLKHHLALSRVEKEIKPILPAAGRERH